MDARFNHPVHLLRAWPPPEAPEGARAFAFQVSLPAAEEERAQPLLDAVLRVLARNFPAASFGLLSGGEVLKPATWEELRGECFVATRGGTSERGAAMLLAGPEEAVRAAIRKAVAQEDPREGRQPGLLATIFAWQAREGRVEYFFEGVHDDAGSPDVARALSRELGLS